MTNKIKSQKWKPEIGENYWYIIISEWEIFFSKSTWSNDKFDRYLYKIGDVFRTKKEAQMKFKEIKEILRK